MYFGPLKYINVFRFIKYINVFRSTKLHRCISIHQNTLMYFFPSKYIDVFWSIKIHQCICVILHRCISSNNIFFGKKRIFTFLEFSKIFKLSKIQAQTDLWYEKLMLNDYFHLHLSATAIPRWIYQFSFDHWSQATSGPVSTWMGDRLGTLGAVGT